MKWLLLQALLRKAIAGELDVFPHWTVQLLFGSYLRIPAAVMQRELRNGYIWIDYASVPQLDKEQQALAIASLASYVGDSNFFICLAGPWTHADNGTVRDVRTWGDRGWCRLENLANALRAPKPHQSRSVFLQCER